MIIKEIDVKSVMTKTNLPVSDYAVNPYVMSDVFMHANTAMHPS